MTTAQLASRLGVSKPRVVAIEKAEARTAITLDSLERAAHALDCRLVYTLVPRKPLDELVEDRAKANAKQRLQSTSHSMALEAQTFTGTDEEEQLKRLTNPDLLLVSMGRPRLSWGRVDLVDPGETRQRYVDALLAADHHDIGPLLECVRS